MRNSVISAALASVLANLRAPEMMENAEHPAMRLHSSKRKGYFPQGKKINITPKYKNPRGAYVKNKAQAAQMNGMHDAWHQKKFGN